MIRYAKLNEGLRGQSNVKQGLKLSTVLDFEPKLIAEEFNKYVLECSTKLSCDECYSEETTNAFKNFELSEEEAMISFQHVKNVIQTFDGDGEKFFPPFYNCVSGEKHAFPHLSRKCSVLLGYEVANSILAHLNGQHKQDNTNNNTSTVVELNCKEKNIVTYLSGYVFGTLYRRLRRSKTYSEESSVQCLSLLAAGKSLSSVTSSDTEVLVNIKNRGGLWKVNSEVVQIFEVAEKYFRLSVVNYPFKKKYNCHKLVSTLMKDISVLSNFSIVR